MNLRDAVDALGPLGRLGVDETDVTDVAEVADDRSADAAALGDAIRNAVAPGGAAATILDRFDALRRPEHTGANRCWPCTAVNAALVLLASAVLARRRRRLGAVVLAVGAAAVGLRGYAVPYTPRFAPRLLKALPVDVPGLGHDRGPDGRTSGSLAGGTGEAAVANADDAATGGAVPGLGDDVSDPSDLDGEAITAALFEAGALVGGEAVDLAPDLRADWESRAAALRDAGNAELARRTAAAAPFPAVGSVDGEWVVVESESGDWATSLRRPVAIAETAAVEALAAAGVAERYRAPAARPLRLFLTTCPACGGPIEETTLANCCGGTMGFHDTPGTEVLACADCEAVLYEFGRDG